MPPIFQKSRKNQTAAAYPGKSAIGVLQSMLSRKSTPQHLKEFAAKGVVTADQIRIWKDLRPKLAHGKIADYNEDLWHKRNQLIGMVYRLAARVLGYKGTLTDYTQSPAIEFNFQWTE